MDIVPYLSTVILVATIATILLAVLSYASFKLRDRRRPRGGVQAPAEPVEAAVFAIRRLRGVIPHSTPRPE